MYKISPNSQIDQSTKYHHMLEMHGPNTHDPKTATGTPTTRRPATGAPTTRRPATRRRQESERWESERRESERWESERQESRRWVSKLRVSSFATRKSKTRFKQSFAGVTTQHELNQSMHKYEVSFQEPLWWPELSAPNFRTQMLGSCVSWRIMHPWNCNGRHMKMMTLVALAGFMPGVCEKKRCFVFTAWVFNFTNTLRVMVDGLSPSTPFSMLVHLATSSPCGKLCFFRSSETLPK